MPACLHASCASPANAVEAENCLPGTPQSTWDVPTGDAGDPSIQGFADQISVNAGSTINFKINTNAAAYTIDIYRMGYYQGNGARKITSITPSATLPQSQPQCYSDNSTNLVDCGNWAISASWPVPSTALSGIYFAKLTRTDTGGASHIVWIVRNDSSTSDVLFQTSDETWQAYNDWGGHSLYGPALLFDITNRAYKVSYNRPFDTRSFEDASFVFYAEYPMVRWLEANAYNVTYFTSVDAAVRGNLITQHKLYLSVGHDEYWSKDKRTSIVNARNAGVNLAFFSGNEGFWKTRWESSIDGSNTPNRTLVTYKETISETQLDPLDSSPTWIWTGTWRDPTFSPPADGGQPENAVTGTLFRVNGCGIDNLDLSIMIPAADGHMRFWRNTPIASQPTGQTWTLFGGTLGYEWDIDDDNGFRPTGLFHLSTATYNLTTDYLLDFGGLYGVGTATHNLTLYRAPSHALVFGAGTVQWSWGLDATHDAYCTYGLTYPNDANMQQATVNLFADMGVQPGALQSGLLPASPSTDTTPPVSSITSPTSGATVQPGNTITITGTASDTGGVVGGVDVSLDGGVTWHPANGRESWNYTWIAAGIGSVNIRSRAVDDSGNVETPSAGVNISVAQATCPCTIWSPAEAPTLVEANDPTALELGVKFRADFDGTINGIRYYKGPDNTGTHVGNLWTTSGTLLGSVTFTNETGSGWQEALFSSPVPITANTEYVASYSTTVGYYSADVNYFATSGHDNPPLHALQNAQADPDGVYGTPGTFPTNTTSSNNYWVDVVYEPTSTVSLTSITVSPSNPTLPIGHTQQFTATATYTDNSTKDITAVVTWGSSNASVASMTTSGVATAIAGGTSTISATLGLVTGTTTMTVQSSPLVISTTSLLPASKNAPYSMAVIATGGVQPYSWSLTAGSALPPGLSMNSSGQISGTPTGLGPYSFTLQVQDSGTKEGGVNQQQTAVRTFGLNVGASIWIPSASPNLDDVGPDSPVELGVKFESDVAGVISGIRFYKSPANTGAHTGHLWDNNGNLLGSVTFSNETASGWQEADFAIPVAIAANTVYIASYHTDGGHEAADSDFFDNSGADNPPLHALQAGVSGSNGIYIYDLSCTPQNRPCFPNNATTGTNYWVDVNLATPTAALSSITVAPANPSVAIGSTQQFTATGNYSDGSHQVLTELATWASTNTSVATINSVGLATAAALGSSTISATYGSVSGNTTLTVIPTPLSVTTTTLTDAVQDVPYTATLAATGGVPPYTWSLASGSNLPAGLSLASNGQITGTTETIATSSFTVQVQDSLSAQATQTLSLTVDAPPPFFTIWSSSATPSTIDAGADNPLELGLKFTSDRDGVISGIRFYKGADNVGTHSGSLWDNAGNLLATVTFTNESASGWQEADFSNPVPVTANTVYVAAYHAAVGHYSYSASYFTNNGVDNFPLHALQTGVSGANGIFAYDTSCAQPPCFPNGGAGGTNYWVDVAFIPVRAASLAVNPTSVIGSNTSTGTVTLVNPAPAGGASISLTSSNTAAATVPSSVTVPASATQANFTVNTSAIPSTTQVTITAPYSGGQQTTLTVTAQYASSTALALTGGTNPSIYGQSVTFTATVSGSGPAPTGAVSFYDGGSCSGTLLAASVPLSSGHASFAISSLVAGSHSIAACYQGDDNYSASNASLGQPVNVATVTPVVTISSKTYDGTTAATIATRSLTGVVGSDDVALTGGSATFADASAATGKTVTITGLGLTGSTAGNYQLSSTSTTAQADITARPVTVTADAQSKTYGAADPTFTYQISGGSLVSGDSFTGALTRAAGESVGAYAILQGTLALNSNYSLAFVSANLTIGTAQLTITAANTSRQYGLANPVFTGSVVGVLNGDGITAIYGTVAGPASPVGGYAIVPTPVDPNNKLGNYSVSLVNGTLTVTQAPLTVTASDASRLYGAPNPAFSGTITGILNGDNITATYATTATQTSPVGTYPITPTLVDPNGLLPNYSVTSNNGTLTITNALSIWAPTATPTTVDLGPDNPVELGVKFKSDITGTIVGLRFYKSAQNTGTHVGNLWDSAGHLLGTVTFTNETASGWQEADFATPVAVAANTVYVASYHTSVGHESADGNYFTSAGVDNPPLHALQNGVSGSNGVYAYGSNSLFPTGTTSGTNYWVDVVMVNSSATLNSITVAPANPSVNAGTPQYFTATGAYSNGSQQNLGTVVTWASDNTAVATIDSYGNATTITHGTAHITATLGSVSAGTTLTVTPQPLSVTTTTLTDPVQNQPYAATLAATGGVPPYTWSIAQGSLPLGLSLATNGQIAGSADVVGTVNFTVQVQDSESTNATKSLDITVDAPPPFYSIWSPSVVPSTIDAGPDSQVELGVKFKADSNGLIAGIRFYKSTANVGAHAGDLWDINGNLLGTVTFSNETESGWQEADFATPVAITANTEYVASYHTTVGHYSLNASYFASSGVDNVPLHALQNSAQDSDGVFAYDTGACGPQNALPPCFPNGVTAGTNFWVDVAFVPLSLASVSVPSSVIGGNSVTGTVTLSGAAPAGGAVISLASSNTAAATVPSSVTISAGATSATFPVNTSVVGTATQLNISATYQSLAQAALTVSPELAPTVGVTLTSGTNPSSYGQSLTFTATLTGSGPAPTGTLTFYDGGTCSAPGTLLATGSALTISSFAPGAHTVLVCYGGDNNYTSGSGSFLQTVNPATVTAVIAVSNKVYDGTTAATITSRSLTGVLGADNVTLNGGTATFSDANAGIGKTVTGTSFTLGGSQAADYQLSSPTATTSASIMLAPLSVTAANATRSFGAADPSFTGTLSGVVGSDDITATFTSTDTLTSPPGTYAIVPVLVDPGSRLSNYSVTSTNGVLTITPVAVTAVSVSPSSITGGSLATGTITLSGIAPSGGATISLQSDTPSAANVPVSVVVPAGQNTASFSLTAGAVGGATNADITATLNGTAQTTVTINPGSLVSRAAWAVTADSQEINCFNGAAANAIDNDPTTMWLSQFCGVTTPMPHWIQINLGGAYDLTAFQYLPRQDGCSNGWIKQYELYVSADGVNWGSPVTSGTFSYGNLSLGCPGAGVPSAIQIAFPQTTGQYVRLRALSEVGGHPWAGAAEINLLGSFSANNPSAALSQVTLSPAILLGGSSSQGTVTLTEPAPAGGAVVNLASNDGSTTVPASVTVPAFTLSTTFNITTTSVAAVTPVNISATYNGTAQAQLTVNPGGLIPQGSWIISADSQETGCYNGAAANAIDGNPNSMWVTQFCGGTAVMPHWIQINLGATYALTGFQYLARQDGCANGWIKQYEFYVSADGVNWGSPVSSGNFNYGNAGAACPGAGVPAAMQVAFPQTTGQYVRLRALSEVNGNPWAAAAEVSVFGVASAGSPPPSLAQVAVNPTLVVGGASSQGTVTLSGPAPAGGISVALASNDSSTQVPASVTVPANAFSATFNITTSSVTAVTPVTISGSYNGSAQASFTVNPGSLIPQGSWLVSADSQATSCFNGVATNAVDGNANTLWVTEFCNGTTAMPHWFQANLGAAYDLTGFQYLARQDNCSFGWIKQYEFYVSSDGVNWGSPVASGTFNYGNLSYGCPGGGVPAAMQIAFPKTTGQYVQLRALSEVSGNPWAVVAELNLLGSIAASAPPPSVAQVTATPTIVVGGTSIQGTVALSGPAPEGGVTVALGSSDPSAQVPASVTIPTNYSSANFTIATSATTAAVPVTITATYNGSAQAGFTVNPGSLVSQAGWSLLYADSQETLCFNGAGVNAFDGNPATTWVTQLCNGTAPLPHEIQINLGATYNLTAFQYLPAQDGESCGWIKQYEFYVSTDGVNWGSPLASGAFNYGALSNNCAGIPAAQQIAFPQTSGQYIRLRALSEQFGNPYIVVAEINVLSTSSTATPALAQVTASPAIVVGGTSAVGTITLTAPAPSGGASVSLSSSDPSTVVPAAVLLPANAVSANFPLATSSVNVVTPVSISATYNGSAQANFTVNPGSLISQAGWSLLYADSQEGLCFNGSAVNAFDGNPATTWVTQLCNGTTPLPHEIQINLGAPYNLTAFQYLPAQDGESCGWIQQYEFYVSTDGSTWGSPVASGTFNYGALGSSCTNVPPVQQIAFPQTTGQYIRLRALSEQFGNPYIVAAEINVIGQ